MTAAQKSGSPVGCPAYSHEAAGRNHGATGASSTQLFKASQARGGTIRPTARPPQPRPGHARTVAARSAKKAASTIDPTAPKRMINRSAFNSCMVSFLIALRPGSSSGWPSFLIGWAARRLTNWSRHDHRKSRCSALQQAPRTPGGLNPPARRISYSQRYAGRISSMSSGRDAAVDAYCLTRQPARRGTGEEHRKGGQIGRVRDA